MNFKTLLISSLLVLILLSTVGFGFLTYTLYSDQASKAAVTSHQLFFYILAVLHVAMFGVTGAVFYKV